MRAPDGVDLAVEEGTVLGLLGERANKRRRCGSSRRCSAGRAAPLGNLDVLRDAWSPCKLIGLSGQYAAVDENLTGRENLWMFGRLYQLNGEARRRRRALEQFGLGDGGPGGEDVLSGMPRRLDLAGALVGRPRLLFLDEPTTGLDPRSRLGMWDVIREQVREGTTLLLTTQYLEEADEPAHEIAVVDHGRIIARGTADELETRVGGERIEVVVQQRADIPHAIQLLAPNGGSSFDEHTRRLTISAGGGAQQLVDVVRRLGDASIEIDDVGLRRPTLDVFLTLTGHAAEQENAEEEQGSSTRSVRHELDGGRSPTAGSWPGGTSSVSRASPSSRSSRSSSRSCSCCCSRSCSAARSRCPAAAATAST